MGDPLRALSGGLDRFQSGAGRGAGSSPENVGPGALGQCGVPWKRSGRLGAPRNPSQEKKVRDRFPSRAARFPARAARFPPRAARFPPRAALLCLGLAILAAGTGCIRRELAPRIQSGALHIVSLTAEPDTIFLGDRSGELPQELQPGSGANDALLTSTYSQALGALTAGMGATWRRTGTLTKIDVHPETGAEVERKYRFGNELLYGVALGWSPDARWGFELGLRGRHAEPDRESRLDPDGTVGPVERLPSTGGERVWIAPTIRFAGVTRNTVTAGILVPLYENLRGSQLGSGLGIRFSVEGRL
jgi:hypothetical protein